MDKPQDVLDFWLTDVGEDGWYSGGAALDARCRARWLGLWEAAAGGALEDWLTDPMGLFAFVLVTDQFSRNIHRDTAQAFTADARARDAARLGVARNWDLQIAAPERQFCYMPFVHHEDMTDQDWAVVLMADRLPSEPDNLLHARAHREVIARFGRFPFRNTALGRDTTEAEAAFLADGGYGAIVRSLGG